jgi:hypothetical protein
MTLLGNLMTVTGHVYCRIVNTKLTKLDDAMGEQMAYIVLSETRPFSYRDFLKFKVNDNEHTMDHGTFRNKISKLKKAGNVELCYYSSCAFYTLKGHKFGKPMTPDRMGVHNSPLYKMLQDLPFDKQSIHDIRLTLEVPNIWKTFSVNPEFYKNEANQDIAVPTWHEENSLVRIYVHKTDKISIIISCSVSPIPLTYKGTIRFFNLLVRAEEKLRNIVDNNSQTKSWITIPDYKNWIVVMWHFGRDALQQYTGEKFSITVEDTQNVLARIYSKDFNNKRRIRIEKQEYPKKTVIDAIEEKLGRIING